MALSNKQRAFIAAYVRSWNATQAAIAAGYSERTAGSQGSALLKKLEIQEEIQRRLEELTMTPGEVLTRLTEQARGDIGAFFRIVEEWTFYPLPSYDIIDAKEVEEAKEDGTTEKRTCYWVRHVAVDTEAFIDPQRSRLIRKFKDSPKEGIVIELHDVQGALKLLGQRHGLFSDKVELTGKDGGPLVLKVVYESKRRGGTDDTTA